ncbi:hypothetical protein BLA24_17630 [Streptomyces cinnamoneus]|uniref:Uncharacterized protein n=1 Tax=Streptomyces cinnamoneus TaxID=53446 RepID=A0A2G1XI34_STRCJ|nr:hypothetical protein BLA24_17630 [Streptomyces cinnamoneus]PPT16585.1 hypothetical protein CYQ11_15645 [Streptomyces cinnamoneus]
MVTALREVAGRYDRAFRADHAIGADQSARRTSAGAFAVTDEDGSLPHEVLVELPGRPEIEIQVFSEGDAKITVEGVEFHDVPAVHAPAFTEAVLSGLARVKTTWYPPFAQLIVPLPGDATYKEPVPWAHAGMSRWLSSAVR